MPPSASRLTTEGQSVLPNGPGMHFGSPVFASTYATRLFVVPRSIPTVRPISELRQFLLNVHNKIPNIRPAVQQFVQPGHNALTLRFIPVCVNGGVPLFRDTLQFAVNGLKLP